MMYPMKQFAVTIEFENERGVERHVIPGKDLEHVEGLAERILGGDKNVVAWDIVPIDTVYEQLVAAYDEGGVTAVEQLCAEMGIVERAFCRDCEADAPVWDGACAVCGISIKTPESSNV